MSTPPSNPTINTSRPATNFIVWQGDTNGTDPIQMDEVIHLRNPRITRTAGSRNLDSIEFDYDLDTQGYRIQDSQLLISMNRQIEIRVPTSDGNANGVGVAWGEMTRQRLELGRGREAVTITARIEPYHFGVPLDGYIVRDPQGNDLTVHEDPVFQPTSDDGLTNNNMSDTYAAAGDYYIWLAPESAASTAAQTVKQQTVKQWTLPEALKTICRMLNDGVQIANPDVIDIDTGLPHPIFDDAAPLINERLKRGTRLPELLDQLLHPRGYSWYVGVTLDPDIPNAGYMRRKIVVFKKGYGLKKNLHHQQANTVLNDLSKQNINELDIVVDIADLANVLIGQGSKTRRQITIELHRVWDEADDPLTPTDLRKSNTLGQFADKPKVWRYWSAGEDGSLCGPTAPRDGATVDPAPADPPDFDSVFGADAWTPRKRRPRPLLLYDDSVLARQRLDPVAEMSFDAGATWHKASHHHHGLRIATDHLAVYFDDDEPPAKLVHAGDNARVRLTCTIDGEQGFTHTADRRDESPNGREVKLWLNLEDQYHDRLIQRTGTFASELFGRTVSAPIVSVTTGDAGNCDITVGADIADNLTVGQTIVVQNSSTNDGTYTIRAGVISGATTIIPVEETIDGITGDGSLYYDTDERDDETALQESLATLQAIEEAAELSASFELFGLHFDFEIGNIIETVEGRRISLNRYPDSSGRTSHLQVTGITHEQARQTTTIRTEPYNAQTSDEEEEANAAEDEDANSSWIGAGIGFF